jgi:hypothetical protein
MPRTIDPDFSAGAKRVLRADTVVRRRGTGAAV